MLRMSHYVELSSRTQGRKEGKEKIGRQGGNKWIFLLLMTELTYS